MRLLPNLKTATTRRSLRHRKSNSQRRELSRRLNVQSLEQRQLLAADTLDITIENLSEDGGLFATPFWVAAHDGTFDLGDIGGNAADFDGLELIAEEGDTSGLVARFAAESNGNDDVVLAPGGFAGAPVFDPDETVTHQLTVDDTLDSRYFSFASMVIPSNDAFIANLNPLAYRLFDNTGDFVGPFSIVIYGSDIYDAGTEVNDVAGGAAFAAAGGTSADEGGTIQQHVGLDDFVGEALVTGDNLGKAFGANTPIARITVAQSSAPSSPIDSDGPLASFFAEDLTSRADFHEISVTYSDPSGIDLNSIRPENLRITTPVLTQLDVLSVTTDAAAGTVPREVTATYRVAPASGSFTALDNGTYSVVLLGDEVNDSFAHPAAEQLLGDFTVNAPVRLNIEFENLSDPGGLGQTPVFIGAHEGNFELARAGFSAADFGGLEALAEEGDVSGVVNRFGIETGGVSSVIFAPDGFAGAPVFEPGEVEIETLDITNPLTQRFFSFASMVIPSNDAFIANLNPRAYELFDSSGEFLGARTITVYGRDIWDAGTEVNAVGGGAAFSTEGGTGVDENGVIRRHQGLDEFVGTGLPTGENLGAAFGDMTPLGRFTISLADIAADAIDRTPPRATLDVATASLAGQATHEIRVTYSDPSGIDVTSIDTSDLRIESGFGDPLEVISVSTDAAVGESPRTVTATYTVAPLDGQPFSTFDNGLYFVNLLEDAVGDTLGNESDFEALGSFEVLLPVELEITVENLSAPGGLAQTPFWIALHEGNFQVAAANSPASNYPGLEALAEEGDVSGVIARFAAESGGTDGVVFAPDGFAGAPVFEPGEISSSTLEVFDTNENRYFSFASMIIPSNDAFVANLNPRAYEVFDENGFFRGEQTILVVGRDIWDAGTEVNAVGGGAAFSTEGGTGVDENGVIRRHEGLDEFIGTGLPTGDDLLAAFQAGTPIARITIRLAGSTTQPVDDQGPAFAGDSESVTDAGVSSHDVTVTFNDPSGIDLTSIDTDDIRVSGPLGAELDVVGASFDATLGTAPTSVTVTYTITTDDGEFTARNNGRYNIEVQDGQVFDTLGLAADRGVADVLTVDVGVRLEITIESLTEIGGLGQTPFWVGFHNGSFEVARGGLPASQFPGLELIAETGDASELVARFAAESDGTDAVIGAPAGFAGAPVFEPGEVASLVIEIDDSELNQYFSFASMTIPSNDAFVGNRDPRRYELFDSNGNFRGARQITLRGGDILDAGTEVNDPFGGAAFSTEGGAGVDENGVIRVHPGLDDFIGTGLPTGDDLLSAFNMMTPIARITISLFDPVADVCSDVTSACSVQSVSLQNARNSADVNRDGFVTPLDSLLIINFLDRFGNTETIADEAQATGLDLDVGGDFNIAPSDAITVINEISELFGGSGAEGEQTDSAIMDFLNESDEEDALDETLASLF
ncbi:MAG: spondin domain-containing protein [Planctomycetota bacterium]